MIKVSLCICTNRGIRPKTAQCLLDLVNLHKEIDFHVLVAERGYTIAENRNYCVIQAQRNNSDYLFFVDDDMTFENDTLGRLLVSQKDIIGVNSYSRCLPHSSTVGLMDSKGQYMHPDRHSAFEMRIPSTPFEAYFVGTGIMLINMDVFKKMKAPYFAFSVDKKGQVLNGEDGTFCDKAKKAGYQIWCDPTVPVGHLGEYEYKKPENEDILFISNINTHASI